MAVTSKIRMKNYKSYPIYNVRNVRVKPCYQLKQLLLIRITEKIHYKLIPFDYLNFRTYDMKLNVVRIHATALISPQTNLEENFKIVLEPGKCTLALYPLYEQPCVHINISILLSGRALAAMIAVSACFWISDTNEDLGA